MATAISLIPTVTSAVTLALTTSPFRISKEGPKLPPVVWEDTWAEGRDTEGAKRTNSRARNGEGSVPLVIVATTETLARDALKSLQKTIYACRSFGGVLRYADGVETVDFQLEAISIGEPDLEMVHRGIVRVDVAFTAGPFAHLPDVILISTAITGTDPQLSIEIPAVSGSAPALALLEITDTETTNYDDVEIGGEFTHYNAAAPASLLIDSADLVVTGMASGAEIARTGAYPSGNVRRASLFPNVYVGLATSGILTAQKGNFRVKGRFWGAGAGGGPIYVRLGQRKGSGPYTYELPRRLQGVDNFYELDLGVMRAGDDGGIEFVIEATSDASGDTIDLDYLRLVPTEVTYARAYGKPITPQTLAAFDGFDVTSADLTGDTAPLGGTWAHVAGDASVWTVPASSGWALRQPGAADGALSGGLNGALARLGTGTTAASVRATVYSASIAADEVHAGLLMRYQATNEFVVAFVQTFASTTVLRLWKIIAGTGTLIGGSTLGAYNPGPWVIDLAIDANGKATVSASLGIGSTPVPLITVTDADLATAGTLGSGGYGLYSTVSSTTSYTRHYDFAAHPDVFTPHALDAGGTLNLTHDTCTQQPALYGAPPEFEGRYLRLPPGGQENKKGRLLVSARRNDRRTLPDSTIDDRVEATLTVTPRVQVL